MYIPQVAVDGSDVAGLALPPELLRRLAEEAGPTAGVAEALCTVRGGGGGGHTPGACPVPLFVV
jgi:hypothetical protein